MLKRLPLFVLIVLSVTLSACSQAPAPEVQGRWSGSVGPQGSSVPVTFTIDPDYQVSDGDFHLNYSGYGVDYEVTTHVEGNKLSIDAKASSASGTLTFALRAEVVGDTMTGSYILRGVDSSDNEVLRIEGSFTATRVP
ncbi:MAG: hypothetical protein WC972_04090 [Trueperaceae bacterium]